MEPTKHKEININDLNTLIKTVDKDLNKGETNNLTLLKNKVNIFKNIIDFNVLYYKNKIEKLKNANSSLIIDRNIKSNETKLEAQKKFQTTLNMKLEAITNALPSNFVQKDAQISNPTRMGVDVHSSQKVATTTTSTVDPRGGGADASDIIAGGIAARAPNNETFRELAILFNQFQANKSLNEKYFETCLNTAYKYAIKHPECCHDRDPFGRLAIALVAYKKADNAVNIANAAETAALEEQHKAILRRSLDLNQVDTAAENATRAADAVQVTYLASKKLLKDALRAAGQAAGSNS